MAPRRGDHLADVEGDRLHAAVGEAQIAGIGRALAGQVGLALLGLDDDVVDDDTRHLDQLARDGAGGRHLFDLGDDDAAMQVGSTGDREVLAEERLVLHRDVAALVGRGAADDRDIDRKAAEEQVLLAPDGDELDQVLGRARALPAAAVARVDEGVEPGAGEEAGAAGRHVAAELGEGALRQGVGLDLVGDRHGGEARAVVEAATDHPPGEAGLGQDVEAGLLPVADRDDAHQREITWAAALLVVGGQRLDEGLGHGMAATRATDQDAVPGPDQGRGLGGRDELDHACS
ncbi:MAG: hypothetical protein R3D28_20285 [Geminicoccaceae bacterium]